MGCLKSDFFWPDILEMKEFTAKKLAFHCEINQQRARGVIRHFETHGNIKTIKGSGKRGDPYVYRVVSNSTLPAKKPRKVFQKKTGRQRIWNTMKIMGNFSIPALEATASVSAQSAKVFISSLEKSGYILRLGTKRQSFSEAKFKLKRDTGRYTPIVRKDGCWDQNEQKFYPFVLAPEPQPKTMQANKKYKQLKGEQHNDQIGLA